jgi:uncharacterized protein (TIGR02444 family)
MNDTPTQSPITPFWRYSLKLYGQSGVSDVCIALQDGCGIDVNLLLYLFWLASEGRQVTADDVTMLDDKVRSWRELTIIPIRDVRRKLKGAATFIDPGKQEALRDKVKVAELEAERLQQEGLYAVTQSGPLGKPADPSAAARGNVAAYEAAIGATFAKASVELLTGAFDNLVGR